jgi:hypothetical protein
MVCIYVQDIFHLIVGTFSGLSDTGSPSFGRRVVILETLAKYRSCVVMLDLECNDLVNKMCSTFFTVARCVFFFFHFFFLCFLRKNKGFTFISASIRLFLIFKFSSN